MMKKYTAIGLMGMLLCTPLAACGTPLAHDTLYTEEESELPPLFEEAEPEISAEPSVDEPIEEPTEEPSETEEPEPTRTPTATNTPAPTSTAAPASSDGSAGTGSGTAPRTGDYTQLALWLVLLLASACGIFAALRSSKKRASDRNRNEHRN